MLVVDMQEAFVGHIDQWDRVLGRSGVMIRAARLLGVPLLVTEQYPQGLGRTVEPIRAALGDCRYHEKCTFSCWREKPIQQALEQLQRRQVLLVGIETQVCVLQTAGDLLDEGYQVHIAVDAVGSRRPDDRSVALQRLQQAGAVLTTVEAAVFEMTESSRHPAFKEISKLMK